MTPSSSPEVVCDKTPDATTTDPKGSIVPIIPILKCEKSVVAAQRVLPQRSAVVAVEFHYGVYCPPGQFCRAALLDQGYVVFTLADGQKLWATVSANKATVTASFQGAFPPA
jgi:hypothetical protein